jgi:hypothetical protein
MKNGLFLLILLSLAFKSFSKGEELKIYISPSGNNNSSGLQMSTPKKTISSALDQIMISKSGENQKAKIFLFPGKYHLEETIIIDHKTGSLTIESMQPGNVTIMGSQTIEGKREHYQWNIMQLKTNMDISPYAQVYINGKEMILARYPN